MKKYYNKPKRLPQAGIIYAIRSQDIIAISNGNSKLTSRNHNKQILHKYNSNNNKAITIQSNLSNNIDNTDSDVCSNELIKPEQINKDDADSRSTISLSTENIMQHLFTTQDNSQHLTNKMRKHPMSTNIDSAELGTLNENVQHLTIKDKTKYNLHSVHSQEKNEDNLIKHPYSKSNMMFSNDNNSDYNDTKNDVHNDKRIKHLNTKKRENCTGDNGITSDYLTDRVNSDLLTNYQDISMELNKFKLKFNDLTLENNSLKQINENLSTEINNLRFENSSFKTRNETLAATNLENQNLSRIVDCLNKKIKDLTEKMDENQYKESDNSRKVVELEANLLEAREKTALITVEVEYLRNLLFQKEMEIKKMSQNQKIDECRDLQMKLIHNELVELKGNIRVICRIKPESNNMITIIDNETVQLPSPKSKSLCSVYNFNRVIRPNSSQSDVFNEVKQLVTSFIDGYNVSLISYGQSGTGKTYTMLGTLDDPGIISYSIREIFKLRNERSSWNYKICLSILEIYNEVVYDLLASANHRSQHGRWRKRTQIHDDGKSIHIKGLSEIEVRHEEDLLTYISKSTTYRSTFNTVQNSDSSRSHFIVMLRIYGRNLFQNCCTQGVMMFCDLAGSENCTINLLDSSLTESKYISKSLTVLGRVFEALYKRMIVIPFRDSKLTHILKPSLSGEAKFAFIVTVSGKLENLSSTFRALNLAKKVAQISLGQARRNTTNLQHCLNKPLCNTTAELICQSG